METNSRKKRTNSCSSSSSSSSLKSISRRRLELIPLRLKKPGETTISIQTDLCSEELSCLSQHPVEIDASEFVTASSSFTGKSKSLNRKKRRRRDFNSTKHSRNNSKTSLKELMPNDGLDPDDAAGTIWKIILSGSGLESTKHCHLQWGSEYWTYKCQNHLNASVQNSNGFEVFVAILVFPFR